MKYNLEDYKELQGKVETLQSYLFVTAKPRIEKDYQDAVLEMSAHCPPRLDPLEPDPFDANVELLHSIGRTRGIVYQMLDYLGSQIQTFVDYQSQQPEPAPKKRRHRRY